MCVTCSLKFCSVSRLFWVAEKSSFISALCVWRVGCVRVRVYGGEGVVWVWVWVGWVRVCVGVWFTLIGWMNPIRPFGHREDSVRTKQLVQILHIIICTHSHSPHTHPHTHTQSHHTTHTRLRTHTHIESHSLTSSAFLSWVADCSFMALRSSLSGGGYWEEETCWLSTLLAFSADSSLDCRCSTEDLKG